MGALKVCVLAVQTKIQSNGRGVVTVVVVIIIIVIVVVIHSKKLQKSARVQLLCRANAVDLMM